MKNLLFGLLLYGLILGAPREALWAQQQYDVDKEFPDIVAKGIDSLQTREQWQHARFVSEGYLQKHGKDPGKKDLVVKAHLIKAQSLLRFERTRLDAAIFELTSGLRKDPNDADLNRELGIVYMNMDKLVDARKYLQTATVLNRADRRAWQALMDLSEKHGNSEQRIEAYKGYLDADPKDARIWTKLGEEYLKTSKAEEAKSAFVKALEMNGYQTEARLQLAKLKEEKNDWAGAIAEYNTILDYDPHNATAKKRLAEAQPHFQNEQEIGQQFDAAKNALQSNDPVQWENARQGFEKVLTKDIQHQEAQAGLRQARKKLYDHANAEGCKFEENKSFRRAFDCFMAAVVYADSKQDQDLAFEKQKQAAIQFGKEMEAQNAYDEARQALKSGQFSRALKSLFAAERLASLPSPKFEPVKEAAQIGEHYEKGLEAYNRGDYELAKMYFKLVNDADPGYKEVQRYYSQAAQQVAKSFLISHYQAAMAKKDWAAARSDLNELVALEPDNSQFIGDLEMINKKMRMKFFWYLAHAVIVLLGLFIVFFVASLFRGFRNIFLKRFKKISKRIEQLPSKTAIALSVVLLYAGFISMIYFPLVLQKGPPAMVKWANENEGLLALIGMFGALIAYLFGFRANRLPPPPKNLQKNSISRARSN